MLDDEPQRSRAVRTAECQKRLQEPCTQQVTDWHERSACPAEPPTKWLAKLHLSSPRCVSNTPLAATTSSTTRAWHQQNYLHRASVIVCQLCPLRETEQELN